MSNFDTGKKISRFTWRRQIFSPPTQFWLEHAQHVPNTCLDQFANYFHLQNTVYGISKGNIWVDIVNNWSIKHAVRTYGTFSSLKKQLTWIIAQSWYFRLNVNAHTLWSPHVLQIFPHNHIHRQVFTVLVLHNEISHLRGNLTEQLQITMMDEPSVCQNDSVWMWLKTVVVMFVVVRWETSGIVTNQTIRIFLKRETINIYNPSMQMMFTSHASYRFAWLGYGNSQPFRIVRELIIYAW